MYNFSRVSWDEAAIQFNLPRVQPHKQQHGLGDKAASEQWRVYVANHSSFKSSLDHGILWNELHLIE